MTVEEKIKNYMREATKASIRALLADDEESKAHYEKQREMCENSILLLWRKAGNTRAGMSDRVAAKLPDNIEWR